MTGVISLNEQQFKKIEAAAEADYPAECCGLLVGLIEADNYMVTRVVPSLNIKAEQAKDRFEIDPQTHIDLERELRGASDQIIGHYHSHPDHPPNPSETDLKMAYGPALIWLIASVNDGKFADLKAHQINETTQQFEEITLSITSA
jgi:proteasome lid subunit RPN8/RPN11